MIVVPVDPKARLQTLIAEMQRECTHPGSQRKPLWWLKREFETAKQQYLDHPRQ